MNLCSACGEDFGSLESFDAHRVGNYPQRGPSEYEGAIEDWTADKGRRCLTVEEMESGTLQSRQFVHNRRGRWSLERRLTHARKSFSSERAQRGTLMGRAPRHRTRRDNESGRGR
jgi:hypothetical protein